jgi:hypothetical protein
MLRKLTIFIILLSLTITLGCAGLRPNYESPTVNITSFRLLPSDGLIPRFEIGMRVINPNRSALNLQGLSYSIEIEGHKIVTGVSNDLPHIDGYSEGNVTLVAAANLLSGIRLISELMKENRDTFTYGFEAKLDPGGWSIPFHIQEKGEFSFTEQP